MKKSQLCKNKYRIKTLEEFKGHRPTGWNSDGKMDYLMGQSLDDIDNFLVDNFTDSSIGLRGTYNSPDPKFINYPWAISKKDIVRDYIDEEITALQE